MQLLRLLPPLALIVSLSSWVSVLLWEADPVFWGVRYSCEKLTLCSGVSGTLVEKQKLNKDNITQNPLQGAE